MDKISGQTRLLDSKIEDDGAGVDMQPVTGPDSNGIIDNNDVIVPHEENDFDNSAAEALLEELNSQVKYSNSGPTHKDSGGISMYTPDGEIPESDPVRKSPENAITPGPDDPEGE